MRHTTPSEATGRATKTPAKFLATAVAAALVASGLGLAAAAPASAAVAGTVTGGEFSWKISEQTNSHLSSKLASSGATVAPTTGVFTFTGGTGSLNSATGVADVQYVGSARSAFLHPVTGAEVYSLTVADPKVTVSAAGAGEIIADVTYSVGAATPVTSADVVVTRFSTADSAPFTQVEGTATLTDTPFWAGVMPAGGADATELGLASNLPLEGKAFAKEFLTFLKPSGLMAHFHTTGTDPASTTNVRKSPATFTASANVVRASTVALALSAGSAKYGTSVTATATVAPAVDGTVTFTGGTTVLGTATVAGGVASVALAGLSVGTHSIVATYSGSTSTDAAASAAASLKVTKLSSKVTVKKNVKFKKNSKPKVTVTVAKQATGDYAKGKVTVYVSGKAVKTVTLKASAKGKVTVTLPKKYAKSIKVKAKFLGSDVAAAKTSATVKVTVKK